MAKLTTDQLEKLSESLGQTTEEKSSNTERMVKDVLSSHPELEEYNYEVFTKGSYKSDIGVDGDCDVDLCIMIKKFFRTKYPPQLNNENFGNSTYLGNLSFEKFRESVLHALKSKFGNSFVQDMGKCIRVRENTYRVQADISPSYQFLDYTTESSNPIEGTLTPTNKGDIINFPKIDAKKIEDKDFITNGRYKKIIRLCKRIRNQLNLDISSYVLVGIFHRVDFKLYTQTNSIDSWAIEVLIQACELCLSDSAYYIREINGINFLFIRGDDKKDPVKIGSNLLKIIKYIQEGN